MNATRRLRFTRSTARGGELTLAEPLQPTLAELRELRERVAQHGRVVDSVADLKKKIVEASRKLEQAKAAHEAKVEAAILAGKDPPPPRMGGSEEKRVEDLEAELRSIEDTDRVGRSADNLLDYSARFFEKTDELVEKKRARALERSRELLAALDTSLAEFQALADEASWLGAATAALKNGQRVEPYRERGGDRQVGLLRAALRRDFDEFEARRAAFETERERIAAFEREQEAERQRHAEELRRDADARRVVTEDGRVVERGGVRVGPRGEFQDAEPKP
jgi:hypothetical protein